MVKRQDFQSCNRSSILRRGTTMRTISAQDTAIVATGPAPQFTHFDVSSHSPYFIGKILASMRGYFVNAIIGDSSSSAMINLTYWRLKTVTEHKLTFEVANPDLQLRPTFNGEIVKKPASLEILTINLRAINVPP